MALDWNNLTDEQFLLIYGYPRTPRLDHPPFVPTYEQHTVTWPNNAGGLNISPIDQTLTPTKETAEKLAELYAVNGVALRVIEIPFMPSGPAASDAIERLLQWPNRATIPAGQLARLYTQNLETQWPGVADKLAKLQIAKVWSQGA